MPRHIIYIINPIAGTKTKKGLQSFIEERTKENGVSFIVFPSVASGDYSFLHSVIEENKTTDIVIAAGDGTAGRVINSLMNFGLNFGIIPCGSGNGLAYGAKIPKQAGKALDIVFKGNTSLIDGFYINDHFSCMLCGLGFDAKVAHDFAQQPKRGLITYIKMVVKNYFSAKTYPFEIQLANQSFKTNAYFISIANSNQFGNNFTIAPKANLSDGLLDIVIATDQKKLSLLIQTLRQVRGKNPLQSNSITASQKGLIYFQTDKLAIINPSQAPLHIDGDPAETSEKFQIAVKKKCFKLLQP
jgi:YegS/Rv2252/BmrU family lipid kinase